MPTFRHMTLRRLLFTSVDVELGLASTAGRGAPACSGNFDPFSFASSRRVGAGARAEGEPFEQRVAASRFAPCSPEQLASPTAYRPARLVRPCTSTSTPPIM